MTESSPSNWVVIIAELEPQSDSDLDMVGADLVEFGCSGVEHLDQRSLKIFLESEPTLLARVNAYLLECHLRNISCLAVDETDWITKSEALQSAAEVGNVVVVPLHRAQQLTSPTGKIRVEIEYGLGFGTGHHASTKDAMHFLQEDNLFEYQPKRILDVGTGSGILAIVANKLFGVSIETTECDPDAAENARMNFLNNNTQVTCLEVTDSLADFHGTFDLIIANIYAEVLLELESDFARLTKPGAALLLAGIATDKLPIIECAFDAKRWKRKAHRSTDGWEAMLVRRV